MYRYIRLYAPKESVNLYPYCGTHSNNSRIDLTDKSEEMREKFSRFVTGNIAFVETILGPGDMLFIPRHYWHFVVSVDKFTAIQWYIEHGHEYKHENDYEYIENDDSVSLLEPEVVLQPKGLATKFTTESTVEPATQAKSQITTRTGSVTTSEFSLSTSFWWGRRILKT